MQALQQVFVQNSGAISDAAAATPDLVPDGLLSIFDIGYPAAAGAIDITPAGAVLEDYSVIQLVQGVAAGELPIVSTELHVSRIKRLLKKAYRAPAAQVTTFTVIPAVPAGGGTYRWTIQNLADQTEHPHRRFSFEVTYPAGGTLATADLVAAVNANTQIEVTASTGGADLILTADVTGEAFDVAVDELFIGATETLTTASDKGNGSPAQILELEKNTKGSVAEYYVNDQILGPRPGDSYTFPPRTFSIAGNTYATYTLEYENNFDESINRSFGHQEIILAIDTAVTNEADLELFFASVITTV
jgi:hypothetical protein